MTAPKSCSNCGAAPAPATRYCLPGLPARPSTPFRPGVGSLGDRTRPLRVRREVAAGSRLPLPVGLHRPQAPALPLSATWTRCHNVDLTGLTHRCTTPRHHPLADRGGHHPGPRRRRRHRQRHALDGRSRTTIRPRNTSIRRATTPANTPLRQSRRPRPGSTARCSSRRSRSQEASWPSSGCSAEAPPEQVPRLLPAGSRVSRRTPPAPEHAPGGVVGTPFVQGKASSDQARFTLAGIVARNTKKARHARACRAFMFRTTDGPWGGTTARRPRRPGASPR